RHVHRWLRRPARPLARRQDASLDFDTRRRIGRSTVPRAMESREGARSARERAAKKGRGKTMTRRLLTSIGLVALIFVLAAPQGMQAADPSRLRTTISTLASERFGGRLTGT